MSCISFWIPTLLYCLNCWVCCLIHKTTASDTTLCNLRWNNLPMEIHISILAKTMIRQNWITWLPVHAGNCLIILFNKSVVYILWYGQYIFWNMLFMVPSIHTVSNIWLALERNLKRYATFQVIVCCAGKIIDALLYNRSNLPVSSQVTVVVHSNTTDRLCMQTPNILMSHPCKWFHEKKKQLRWIVFHYHGKNLNHTFPTSYYK